MWVSSIGARVGASLTFLDHGFMGNGKEAFDVGALGHFNVMPPFA
jgi:hypothetical protein